MSSWNDAAHPRDPRGHFTVAVRHAMQSAHAAPSPTVVWPSANREQRASQVAMAISPSDHRPSRAYLLTPSDWQCIHCVRHANRAAVCEGVHAVLFGYQESPHAVNFSASLIGRDVPMPVTTDEIASLMPKEGRIPMTELRYGIIENAPPDVRCVEESL